MIKLRNLLILIFCVIAATENIHAQVKEPEKNVSIVLPPDEENLNVFQDWLQWNNPGSLLINYLTDQAEELYEQRDREISKLNTRSEWMKRQDAVREKLFRLAGPFPEKTPLNPRITGTIKKDGYRVDKIVYESMPGFYVTGCLYVPDVIKGKAPAILNVIGHNQDAFRMSLYQVLNYNLVKKGMIIFAIDPPGQGEHVQYYDPAINFSSIGYSVIEHCYFGYQCFLSGSCAARYFIWDGIRAIDYLLTRKDVDPERIGVTGFSGGGTVTSYISAFDDRVKVSVPCSWATTNRRQLETKGIQDAENIFIAGLAEGITLEDLLEVRAPKPTLMTFTSRDEYLTVQGARDAWAEAKKAYQAHSMEDNIEFIEEDYLHWMTPKIRHAIYAFFMKHFDLTGDPSELEAEILSAEDLKVTPTGQISTSFGGDMIFDVNRKETEKLMADLERSRQDIEKHLSMVRVRAREISGFVEPSERSAEPFINGKYRREGYSVGKYAIMGEGNYPVPFLLFVPDDDRERHPALVWLNSGGKDKDAKPGGEIEKLVRKGYVVAAADVSGTGELLNTVTNKEGTADAGNTAVLIGRSVAGIQAGDIVRVVNYLKSCSNVDTSRIGAVGINEVCIPLIHAAAFDHSIRSITLIGSPVSYRSIAMNRIYRIGLTETGYPGPGLPYWIDFSTTIPGVLTAYDLPDLIGCIAPRKVAISGLKDHALEPAAEELISLEMNFPSSVYTSVGVRENLKIETRPVTTVELIDWCFR